MTFAELIRPPGLDAVAAFDAVQGDGQLQLLGHFGDGGIHIEGAAAVGPVALGGKGDGAALTGNAHAGHDGGDIRGLLLDGNGRHDPADQLRYPAQGEDVLRGHIIDGTLYRHADKELVEGGLMVHEDQVSPVPLLPEGFRADAIADPGVGIQHQPGQIPDHTVAVAHPLFIVFLLFHSVLR